MATLCNGFLVNISIQWNSCNCSVFLFPQPFKLINDIDIEQLLLDYISDVVASGPPENNFVEEIVTNEGELVIDGLEVHEALETAAIPTIPQPTFIIKQEEETNTVGELVIYQLEVNEALESASLPTLPQPDLVTQQEEETMTTETDKRKRTSLDNDDAHDE